MQASRLLSCVCVAAIALAAPARAQEAPPPAPAEADASVLSGDIIVTAQKRDENLQDVGIAIQAFSGDQLRLLGIDKAADIATFTPGVHISGSLAGQNTQFTIRGVVQNDFNDVVEAPNAVYLDEGYIAIAQAQSFSVLDIDRVEVLKGPQGTLFGRNATGGLIHYISRRPSLSTWEGFVDARYGIIDSPSSPTIFTIEGALGGPISDKLAIRGAVRWNKQQPVLRNLYPLGAVGGAPGPDAGANLGDDDTLTGRFTILFAPSETSEILLSANGSRANLATGPYQSKPTIAVYDAQGELINTLDVSPTERRASIIPVGSLNSINGDFGSDLDNNGVVGGPGEIYGRPAGTDFFGYLDPDGADFRTSSDFAFRNQGNVDTWGLNLRGNFELSDAVTLHTVTDYKNYDKLLFIDVDAGPTNQLANYGSVDAESFTQEIRLAGQADSFTWVGGLYFLKIETLSRNGLKAPVNSVVPGSPIDIASTAKLETTSYSAFGQVDYNFTDQWRLVVGGRVIREQKQYDFIQELYVSPDSRAIQPRDGLLFPIGPVAGPDPRYVDKDGQTLYAGKVQLEFRPNDDTLLYAGVNRGVKAGSYNAQLNGGLATPASAIRYGDETLWSYEGGFKLSMADDRVRLNGSLYYYDYKGYQSFLFTGVAGLVINADARTYGGELAIQANPFPGLDVAATVSAFDAVVKDVPLRVGGPVRRDLKPSYAPETQASGLIRYAWTGFGGGEMNVKGDVTYSSSFFYNLRNFDADRFDSYVLVNLGLGWISPSRGVELSLAVDNVTDKRIGLQGYNLATLCGCNEVSYRLPRTFYTRARLNF